MSAGVIKLNPRIVNLAGKKTGETLNGVPIWLLNFQVRQADVFCLDSIYAIKWPGREMPTPQELVTHWLAYQDTQYLLLGYVEPSGFTKAKNPP
ncbi:MAG TPA: hypothetical protein VIS99_12840 [Terrimicrobiaceae bacterium]